MKLASLPNHTRDGALCVVSRDLTRAVFVPEIATHLQVALDNWVDCAPRLAAVAEQLEAGQCSGYFDFDSSNACAPLPRAYQWADGSAYVRHVELVRKARGAELPENFWTDPLMYQGGSDHLIGACAPIEVASEDFGIDFEAEVVVIVDDVPMGVSDTDAAKHIQLIGLVNDVSLRNLIPGELAKGFGFFQSKPATAFTPVLATPDELGDAWDEGLCHLPIYSYLNDELFGEPNAGVDMTFDFPSLIAHAAKTRHLMAGTIIGSGTVSNIGKNVGSSCIAEKRMLEKINDGDIKTPFMQFGDRIRIEMRDAKGDNIFGSIDQQVKAYRHDKN
jgi:fumarylacetoacetate (FAA) hydrolase